MVHSEVSQSSPEITIRPASHGDITALLELEKNAFDYDRLSKRSFKHFIDVDSAELLVASKAADSTVTGYILTLFHRGTELARIYSLAICATAQGKGLARRLLVAAEQTAIKRNCVALRLEVSVKNSKAIQLYQNSGYVIFDQIKNYYEDHETALRFQKRLPIAPQSNIQLCLPYYHQTLEFSCGPAALMMAVAYLRQDYRMSVEEEIEIWRVATTIFMTSGHGGCGPHGLAIAAVERGIYATIYINETGPLFLDSVRTTRKKEVLTLVHEGFMTKIRNMQIPIVQHSLTLDEIERALKAGKVPLILISTYHFDRRKAPHWVVVTAIDDAFIYIHDPDIDPDTHQSQFDNQHLPIARKRFESIARFGSKALKAGLVLEKNTGNHDATDPN